MITKEMTINEILTRYPETLSVFQDFGLDCHDCQVAEFEQLEHGATVHNVEIEALLTALNRRINN